MKKKRRRREQKTQNKRFSRRATEKRLQNAWLGKERKIIYSFIIVYSHRRVVCVFCWAHRDSRRSLHAYIRFFSCGLFSLIVFFEISCRIFGTKHTTHNRADPTRAPRERKFPSFFFVVVRFLRVLYYYYFETNSFSHVTELMKQTLWARQRRRSFSWEFFVLHKTTFEISKRRAKK